MNKKRKEKLLDQTKPGTYIRNNPDYNEIMKLIKEEKNKNGRSCAE